MSDIAENKPKKGRDPRDILSDCRAYGANDYTSVEWCRRNRGEWCKTNGRWCRWSKI